VIPVTGRTLFPTEDVNAAGVMAEVCKPGPFLDCSNFRFDCFRGARMKDPRTLRRLPAVIAIVFLLFGFSGTMLGSDKTKAPEQKQNAGTSAEAA
jgi:hypothetical protein